MIDRAIQHLAFRQPVVDRLTAAYCGLEIAEYALRDLAYLDSGAGSVPLHGSGAAQYQAALARSALARAPSLRWPVCAPPLAMALAAVAEASIVAVLIELADALIMALAETAADIGSSSSSGVSGVSGDRSACQYAALHTDRMRTRLQEMLTNIRIDSACMNDAAGVEVT